MKDELLDILFFAPFKLSEKEQPSRIEEEKAPQSDLLKVPSSNNKMSLKQKQ